MIPNINEVFHAFYIINDNNPANQATINDPLIVEEISELTLLPNDQKVLVYGRIDECKFNKSKSDKNNKEATITNAYFKDGEITFKIPRYWDKTNDYGILNNPLYIEREAELFWGKDMSKSTPFRWYKVNQIFKNEKEANKKHPAKLYYKSQSYCLFNTFTINDIRINGQPNIPSEYLATSTIPLDKVKFKSVDNKKGRLICSNGKCEEININPLWKRNDEESHLGAYKLKYKTVYLGQSLYFAGTYNKSKNCIELDEIIKPTKKPINAFGKKQNFLDSILGIIWDCFWILIGFFLIIKPAFFQHNKRIKFSNIFHAKQGFDYSTNKLTYFLLNFPIIYLIFIFGITICSGMFLSSTLVEKIEVLSKFKYEFLIFDITGNPIGWVGGLTALVTSIIVQNINIGRTLHSTTYDSIERGAESISGEFQLLYNDQLKPKLVELQEQLEMMRLRRSISRKRCAIRIPIVLFILIGCTVAMIILETKFFTGLFLKITFFGVCIAPFVAFTPTYRFKRESITLIDVYKKDVVNKLVMALSKDLSYFKTNGINKSIIAHSQLFSSSLKRKSQIICDDAIRGKIDGVQINLSEIIIKSQQEEGWFFQATFNKNIYGTTLIFPDTAEGTMGNTGNKIQKISKLKGLNLVKLENPTFEKYFAVYSNTPIECRYILTPDFMEELIELRRLGHSLKLSFRNNTVSLFLDLGMNLFEPNLEGNLLDYVNLNKTYFILKKLLGISSSLKLNTEIWKSK